MMNPEDSNITRVSLCDEAMSISYEWRRPSVLFRPRIFPDGDQWCALLGEDLQTGVAGFGETPYKACEAFDTAWRESRPPSAKTKRLKWDV
jgi:hypothetical protein